MCGRTRIRMINRQKKKFPTKSRQKSAKSKKILFDLIERTNAMYLDYETYLGMGGTLTSCEFANAAFTAERIIDRFTFRRIRDMKTIPYEAAHCVFALIELLEKRKADLEQPPIASASNDGFSASFTALSPTDEASLYNAEVKACIQVHFAGLHDDTGTPLLYRGACHAL